MSKWGVLLINLGTPQSPETADVGVYLKEFLLDPEVIDLHWVFRHALVRGVIVPFRSPKSSEQYKKVWTKDGSPLAVHTRALAKNLGLKLPGIPVAYGFRYGQPSLDTAMKELEKQGVTHLFAMPLYPQYATSATRTTETALQNLGIHKRFQVHRVMRSFHDRPEYIEPVAELIRKGRIPGSHILFSFHSIPVRHIEKNHQGCEKCLREPHCQGQGDQLCYRRQCFETTRLVAQKLNLAPDEWSISFQSRLGRAEWLTPNTENWLREKVTGGIKSLTLVAAGFTADCLETLEELDVRALEIFEAAGGQNWSRISCLNADPLWVERLSQLVQSQISFLEVSGGKTPSQSPQ